jgi:hypothetical protein
MTNYKHHGLVTAGPTGTRRMEKASTGTRRMEKGSSGDFYDELQASRISTVWRSMTKRRSLQIEYCSSQMCN